MVVDTEPDINIKDLVLAEPTVESFSFKPETLITPQDWQTMVKILSKTDPLLNLSRFAYLAVPLVQLFPHRRSELDSIETMPILWRNLVSEINTTSAEVEVDRLFKEYLAAGMRMKILFPKRFSPDYFKAVDRETIMRRVEQTMETEIRMRGSGMLSVFSTEIANAKILFPQDFSNLDPQKVEACWLKMASDLAADKLSTPEYFAQIAADLRVLKPKRTDRLPLNQETQRQLQGALLEFRVQGREGDENSHTRWRLFAEMARNMKILAAKDLVFTEQKFEIIMPDDQKVAQEEQPPERRAF